MSDGKNGVARVSSAYGFDDTFSRLEAAVTSQGLTVFSRIDFNGDAAKGGLKMMPTKMLVFGDPSAGTPLMVASPSLPADLPLKVVASEDTSGKVWMSYNSPEYLRERHGIPEDLLRNIAGIAAIVDSVSK